MPTKLLSLKEKLFYKIQSYPKNQALLIVSVNYPGAQKLNGLSLFVFYEYIKTLDFKMDDIMFNELGPVGIKLVDDAYQSKREAIAFESSHPLGRLLDIDVYDKGKMVNRTALEMPQRACLICGRDAKTCIVSKRHTLQEVKAAFETLVIDYCRRDVGRQVSLAMVMEVSVHPSFGLVNPINQGIHEDMDIIMFLRVIDALTPYFKAVATISTKQSLVSYFEALRKHGIVMENIMFQITQGVNTHKGFVFLMLIVLGAMHYDPEREITEAIQAMAQFVKADFDTAPTSTGLYWYQKAGIAGVRGQVLSGLEALIKLKLPYLKKALVSYDDMNAALVSTLLLMMSDCDDTTILKRSDLETLNTLQAKALAVYDQPDQWEAFSQWCLARGLSPGGSADLLGVLVFLRYFFYDKEKETL